MEYSINYPSFFTATILEWKHLLKPNKFKNIIINSLEFLVKVKRVEIFGFVIMSNPNHIIWRISNEYQLAEVQQSYMKFSSQMIIKELRKNHP